MEDNPYARLIGNIRKDTDSRMPVPFRLGSVIIGSPLTLEVAGTVQDSDSLLKNSTLSELNAGDLVLALPIENEQRYIIVCKVVGAAESGETETFTSSDGKTVTVLNGMIKSIEQG